MPGVLTVLGSAFCMKQRIQARCPGLPDTEEGDSSGTGIK
jgi:hypothetical protein